jgi:type II protein arginine methyltransferase
MTPLSTHIKTHDEVSQLPDDLPAALRPMVAAILPRSDRIERLIGLATIVKKQGKPEWAVPLIRLAQTRVGNDGQGMHELRRFWDLPAWHCSVLNDEGRALGYESALRSLVGPNELVLEIGTGSGILALLAAQAGAGQVITCETNPYLVDVAREIIAANGYADRITVLHKSSKKLEIGVDLPRPADILLGDHFTGSFYPGGGLALYQDALGRLTKPEAITLPSRGGIRLALARCPVLAARYRPGLVAGFDFSAFTRFLPPVISIAPDEWVASRAEILSQAVTPHPINFGQLAQFKEESCQIELSANTCAQADGIVSWAWLELADGISWDGGTGSEHRPWIRYLHLFPKPLSITPDTPVNVTVTQSLNGLKVSPNL